MTKIIDNLELEVTKLKNSIHFNIKNYDKFQNFYKTIRNILGVTGDTFSMNARNIIGFNDYIKSGIFLYKHANQMFLNLSEQIRSLEAEGVGLLYIDPVDIYFIEITDDEFYFLILKTDNFLPIIDDHLEVVNPLREKNNMFFSPELKTLKSFPLSVSYKSSYYSIAMLVLIGLGKTDELKTESIKNTRLFWALERCLMKDPQNRTLLYI